MIYGNPRARIEDEGVDKDGTRRVVMVRAWQPSRPGLTAAEILKERPPKPEIGMKLVGPIQTSNRGGYMETRWTFTGAGDVFEFPLQTRNVSTDSSFQPTFAEMDLILHPLWPWYQKVYGGSLDKETGKIKWPPTIPAASGSGMQQGSSQAGPPNPMAGRQTFLHLTGGTYSHSYVETKLPPDLFMKMGAIFETGQLPGTPPLLPIGERRNWLKIAPDYKRSGELINITEHYMLSDIGGWPPQIYPPRFQ